MVRSVLLILLFFGAACGCGALETEWVAFPEHAPQAVWKAAQETAIARYDLDDLDEEAMRLETAWREELAPMSGQGVRTRLEAWVELDEAGRGTILCARVERQINTDMDRPLSLASARWTPDGTDARRARRVLQEVRLKLQAIRPSREILSPPKSKYREKAEDRLWGGKKDEGGKAGEDPWSRER
jgi:hypothetical protein